jgi:energy-coupling factor transporter ATP-binding protein EcfA2
MNTTLTLRNVRVRYRPDAPDALCGVSLALSAGERCALLGLNGSGKTTLLAAIAGLLPYSGTIEVDGIALAPATLRRVRDRLGFLFGTPDDQLLFPQVLDDVAFTLERRGASRDEARRRAAAMLDELGIGGLASSAPHQLSQGQRQRVALAGVLVADPPLVLMDEPTSSLDPVGREELARRLDRQRAALLVATHDADFARRVARRFIVLDAGRIVEDTDSPACASDFANIVARRPQV